MIVGDAFAEAQRELVVLLGIERAVALSEVHRVDSVDSRVQVVHAGPGDLPGILEAEVEPIGQPVSERGDRQEGMIAGRSRPDRLVCVVVAEREIGREARDIVADGGIGRLDGEAREPVTLRSGKITPIDALIVEDQFQRVAPEVDLLFLEKDLATGLPDSRVVVGQRAVVVVVVEITPLHLKIGCPVEIMAVKQVRRIFAELLEGLVVHGGS